MMISGKVYTDAHTEDRRNGGGRMREFIYDWSDASNKHLRYKTGKQQINPHSRTADSNPPFCHETWPEADNDTGRINPPWDTGDYVSDNAFSDNTKNMLSMQNAPYPNILSVFEIIWS